VLSDRAIKWGQLCFVGKVCGPVVNADGVAVMAMVGGVHL